MFRVMCVCVCVGFLGHTMCTMCTRHHHYQLEKGATQIRTLYPSFAFAIQRQCHIQIHVIFQSAYIRCLFFFLAHDLAHHFIYSICIYERHSECLRFSFVFFFCWFNERCLIFWPLISKGAAFIVQSGTQIHTCTQRLSKMSFKAVLYNGIKV